MPITDERMELSISRMLRVGVTSSALIMSLGGFLYLKAAPKLSLGYSTFHPEISSLSSVRQALSGSARLDGASVIQIAMLVLIATPVIRVAFCIVGFARQRDRLYVGISSTVLLILLYSLVQGGQ